MGTDQEKTGISRLREAERLDRLQAELEGVVAKDSRYWLQNDAKFRAVAQVSESFFQPATMKSLFLQGASYEQFEELVATSHLTPLSKEDIVGGGARKQALWNPVAQAQAKVEDCQDNGVPVTDWERKDPTTVKEFREAWISSGSEKNQLALLNKLGDEALHQLFLTDVPVDIFQNIISLFLELDGDDELIIKTLMTFARASRFSLCLMFMESEDKTNVKVLIDRLEKKGLDKVGQLKQNYL